MSDAATAPASAPAPAAERITQREAIARAVLGRLRAALAPIPVQRNRRETVHVEDAPLVTFFDAGHTADLPDTGDTSYDMELPIEATVSAATDDELGAEMNAFYGRVLDALMEDPTLGGLCVHLTERAFDPRIAPIEESQEPLATFSLSVMAEFRATNSWPFHTPPEDDGMATARGSYRHVQHEPATVWTIRHGLGHFPNVVVVDTLGRRIYPGGESYPDENTLVLGFGVPYAGTADLD